MNVQEELLHYPRHWAAGVLMVSVLAKHVSFKLKFLFDGQGAVRRAILYADRSFFYSCTRLMKSSEMWIH